MDIINIVSVISTVILGLMLATNAIVEVLKKITWDKIPTNLLVVFVAEALTLCSGAAYAQMQNITILWYMVVAAVIVGLFVSFSAMYGFDKFQQMIQQMLRQVQARKETE